MWCKAKTEEMEAMSFHIYTLCLTAPRWGRSHSDKMACAWCNKMKASNLLLGNPLSAHAKVFLAICHATPSAFPLPRNLCIENMNPPHGGHRYVCGSGIRRSLHYYTTILLLWTASSEAHAVAAAAAVRRPPPPSAGAVRHRCLRNLFLKLS